MKIQKVIYLVLTLLLFYATKMTAQNDCKDAIIICGNANLSGLTTEGIGIQEISSTNACSSFENNSIWLKVKIRTGGTFGFLITPQSTDLVVDFDFWVFGPNVICGNLGTAIRCSTTNPLNSGQIDNLTGMNATETDISEGPGPLGNSFVKWINVLNDEEYYIAIDRPAGTSDFTIVWTGTATFYEPPVVSNTITLEACYTDIASEDIAIFNLLQNATLAIGNQTNVNAKFYTNYNDAVIENNQISNPSSFQNTTNPQTIFIRLTNNITDCFTIGDFNLNVVKATLPNLDFSYITPICIKGINPKPIFSDLFSIGGVFSATPIGLDINPILGIINLSNSNQGNYTITYTVEGNASNCIIGSSQSFDIKIENCQIPKGISPNDDSKNNYFNLEKFDVNELSIFNRYGIKVYAKTNYIKEWNGLSDSGKVLPDGTYYYLIKLNNGENKSGWVYLNRKE